MAKVNILVGGGPGATREANIKLQNGGFVLPIACAGGAAAGLVFEDEDDNVAKQVDVVLAKTRVANANLMISEHWDAINDVNGCPMRAARIVYTAIKHQIDQANSD